MLQQVQRESCTKTVLQSSAASWPLLTRVTLPQLSVAQKLIPKSTKSTSLCKNLPENQGWHKQLAMGFFNWYQTLPPNALECVFCDAVFWNQDDSTVLWVYFILVSCVVCTYIWYSHSPPTSCTHAPFLSISTILCTFVSNPQFFSNRTNISHCNVFWMSCFKRTSPLLAKKCSKLKRDP